ncbi:MAG: spermidine/putrescine ABC transporter substrate-binding protein [Actinobacteria bacterium]|nr:spermidine/putrescine ABC transporter substrate-binding protein [Actinomycetota bacterium]
MSRIIPPLSRTAIIITAMVIVILVSLAGCSPGKAGDELTVYVWEGYLPQPIIDMFESETGMKLNVNLISDNAAIFTLLKGGGKADIVMPTQNQVNRFYDENLAMALDLDSIENYKNVIDSFKNQAWSMWDGNNMGSGDTYVIPYVFGTSGIVVNTDKYEGSLDGMGWEILFDPLLKGKVSSRNSAESIMICLDLMGIPRENLLNDTEGTLDRVRDKVLELKGNVRKFYGTGAELLDMLGNEEVWISHIWDGGARKLASADDKFVYVLPSTGGFGWTDTFMIPGTADNPGGAHMFIDFMLKPEVAAIVVSEGGYSTTVKGSIDLAEGIDKDLYTYGDDEIANLVWQANFPEDVVAAYNNFWEELSTVN